MGQALYRKYRSRSLSEIVGQEHITQTLEQALKQGRISHAYLFTGPRGVGKTSIARIWAHQINGLPYTDDSDHLDIIEIDAASNRRIDEIRELRDKVYVAPTSAKYKVYIIDEVHMLTKEAFNALLKTLEEPPAHVVFILATTDAHKLPDTIISRTQRFSFKPGMPAKIAAHLKKIADKEKIAISPPALELIADHAGGSFRDSVSLLDQASSLAEKIEVDHIHRLLGIPPSKAVQSLMNAILNGTDPKSLMDSLALLYDQGYQPAAIAKQLGQVLRKGFVEGSADGSRVLDLLEQLLKVPNSHQPERFLEIILLGATSTLSSTVPTTEEAAPIYISKSSTTTEQTRAKTPETVKDNFKHKTRSVTSSSLNAATWPAVLHILKQRHNTLYGLVRMAHPDFSASKDGKMNLTFAFSFHQKRLRENGNQQKLADIIKELTDKDVTIECVVDKAAASFSAARTTIGESSTKTQKLPIRDLTTISNIFGDSELLES